MVKVEKNIVNSSWKYNLQSNCQVKITLIKWKFQVLVSNFIWGVYIIMHKTAYWMIKIR